MNKRSGHKDEVKRELGRPGLKWKGITKVNLTELDAVDCISLAQARVR